MEQDAGRREDMAADLAEVGIVVTPERQARGRRRLAEAKAERTPEAVAAMRELLGLPAAGSAA